ncbi:MAG: ABC transporter permease [Thermoleophilaceae bacterium]|nr:ABC transporter permease [Thermoleophilaceae bacterium]
MESPSYVGATPQQAFAGLANGEVVLGESYATKAGLKVGDSITLKGLAGERKVRIAALDSSAAVPASVYLTTSLDTAVELYGLNQDTSLALKLDAGANGAATRKALEAQLRAYPQLQLSSTAEQKKDVEKQQQQGLSFFYALMFVAILIGLFGVMNTMFISVIQRTREVGVLRAIGARRRQIRKMIRRESILLTVAGTVMGLAVGLILGRVFVYGFNKSITGSVYAVPWGILITSAILSVLFGVLAAVLPARRAARTNVVEAVSYE